MTFTFSGRREGGRGIPGEQGRRGREGEEVERESRCCWWSMSSFRMEVVLLIVCFSWSSFLFSHDVSHNVSLIVRYRDIMGKNIATLLHRDYPAVPAANS